MNKRRWRNLTYELKTGNWQLKTGNWKLHCLKFQGLYAERLNTAMDTRHKHCINLLADRQCHNFFREP